MQCKRLVFFLLLMLSPILGWSSAVVSSYQDAQQILLQKNNNDKLAAMEWIAQQPDTDFSKTLLSAWLEGALYYQKSDQRFFVIDQLKVGSTAVSLAEKQSVVIDNKRAFKKVRINNKLRSELRSQLAKMDLRSSEVAVRDQAVKNLIGNTDPALITLMKQLVASEQDPAIQKNLALAIAVFDALGDDPDLKLIAIQQLSDSKHPIVFKTLTKLKQQSNDPDIQKEAEKGLLKYGQSQKVYSGIKTAFFGLSLGSVLVLAGIGLAITFGVMGVINMAHGELIMIGAYTTYVIQQLMPNYIGASLIVAIPAAFIISGLVGILIERTVIRHLYGRPLETLLATFGLSLILQQAVRSIFSPLNRSVSTPEWMSGSLEINPMLSLTYSRLYIILFCIMVFISLVMILKKTSLGLQVRAVSQNREMARAMGIRSQRVDALTFGLGSGVAGVAGVALSQLTNVGPNMGQSYIIDSFMVVVFGGVGNLWGTLVAGLSLGIFNKVLEPWAGAVLAKILVLVFIILFIQKRPRGLFPQRGRAAEG